ncbi:hypothetical protein SKAU_G00212610 [Synaphobranchus kaupii]|uniref:Uncharacterized protein n=1 Tax=Synaphobranchus kaupii TaxID=118154 RepID=A0A9Q1F919_SYNKA|nr:hypothetical protein SKAU_G00212610 [Synaphobranchus kaupii]
MENAMEHDTQQSKVLTDMTWKSLQSLPSSSCDPSSSGHMMEEECWRSGYRARQPDKRDKILG